jgi:hypothetical protein
MNQSCLRLSTIDMFAGLTFGQPIDCFVCKLNSLLQELLQLLH